MELKELQRSSVELVLLSLLEARARHGYELAKMVESRSGDKLQYQVASIYPMLYRLERKGLVRGRWVEKPNERRRRFYELTTAGKQALRAQRGAWREFFDVLNRIARLDHA